MTLFNLSKIKRYAAVVVFIATAVFLFQQSIIACSWDYRIWQNRHPNSDAYYRFIQDGKAGFIDQTGKIVIEPNLHVFGNYQDGVINGLLEVDFDKYIDIKTGKEVSKEFYEQKIKVYPKEWEAKQLTPFKFGFVDNKENTVIEPKFIYAKDFSEGIAPVVLKGPCSYRSYEDICPGATFFPIGTTIQPNSACEFSFINKKGKIISTQTFLDVKNFSEGLAAVKTVEGWGFINTKGKIVIAPQFEFANSFSEGLALVRVNDLYGYISPTGAFVIEPQFKDAESFSNGLASVGDYCGGKEFENCDFRNSEYYYINKSGKPATSEKFRLASHYFKGIAHVLVSEVFSTEKRGEKEVEIRLQTFAYINIKGEKIFIYKVKDRM